MRDGEHGQPSSMPIKLEYLHVDLGDQRVRMLPVSPSSGTGFASADFDSSFDLVRAGLNVRF